MLPEIHGGAPPEVDNKPSRSRYRNLPLPENTNSRLQLLVAKLLPRSIAYSRKERHRDLLGYRFKHQPPTEISTAVLLIASIIKAFSGGALIIVPMVIMSFNTSHTKSLVTVSVAVSLFAFFLGAVMRSRSTEVFIATATYAAVLVVFVGTTGSGSN